MKKYSIIAIVLAIVFMSIGCVLFIISDGLFMWNISRTYYKMNVVKPDSIIELSEYRERLYEGSLNVIRTGDRTFAPTNVGLLKQRIKFNFKGYGKKDLFRTSEMGYLMISTLETAMLLHDTSGINIIKETFDTYCLNDSFLKVDQSLNGIVASMLYDVSHEKKYVNYMDLLYN